MNLKTTDLEHTLSTSDMSNSTHDETLLDIYLPGGLWSSAFNTTLNPIFFYILEVSSCVLPSLDYNRTDNFAHALLVYVASRSCVTIPYYYTYLQQNTKK